MKTCRIDGVLLKADVPALAVDQTFSDGFDVAGGESAYHVWAGWSAVGGRRAHYVLGLNLLAPYHLDVGRLDDAEVE